jgi:hypothetical protein
MAVIGMAGVAAPAIASAADECMHGFGSHQQLADAAGAMQEWTVTDLKKSADPALGYPLAGQLWEAAASVEAVSGTVTPIIPNFRALTGDGRSYQVLWQLASPQGIPGATLAQGQTSTGKVYFDVAGADPVAVTLMGGGGRPLMWCSCDAMMAMPMPMRMPMENCPCCS